MKKLLNLFPNFIQSILNSYTQVFFSDNKIFAVILIVVCFFDYVAGLSGLLAIIISNTTAYVIGFNRQKIRMGFYGFNSLLVGLGLGSFFQFNTEFVIILLFASFFTLLLTVVFEGIIGKYGLPFLSIPFITGIWLLTLATREISNLQISEKGIYVINELYAIGGMPLVNFYEWLASINIPGSLILYFKSLGAIFFQYQLLSGILISLGLLIYSRIAFSLSLLGFFSAYFFYFLIGANFSELNISYIGFNFILTAIAIGGFFVVSSRYSYLWVILLTPLIAITIISTNKILAVYQLPGYSLSFNVIVLIFLYILKFRERFYNKPEIVTWQFFSPEKNLYARHNDKKRFAMAGYIPFSLPFWGEWSVTQGHDGEYTHKDDWKNAWDFEIIDEAGKAFRKAGANPEDYYCYNKPVVAPYAAYVEEIIDEVDDNEIGELNTEQNWGNTIVLKHAEGLYSILCHLKKNSFKVSQGDMVKKGDVLAHCGNSGHSPQPHLHFQFQATPYIGSRTLDYPLGHYVLSDNSKYTLKSFDRPSEKDIISNIEQNNSLSKAFKFIPGQNVNFEMTNRKNDIIKIIKWEVRTDLSNNTFLYCVDTKAKAFFRADDDIMYFTHYEGSKRATLYFFFLGAYKIMLGYYKELKIDDSICLNMLRSNWLIYLQDFVAPFKVFMKSRYSISYINGEENFLSGKINITSNAEVSVGKLSLLKYFFTFEIEDGIINEFVITGKNKTVKLTASGLT